jgi:hypothetical protein
MHREYRYCRKEYNWYVFIVGGQREDSRLIRLDFGASLSNNSPVVITLEMPVTIWITPKIFISSTNRATGQVLP